MNTRFLTPATLSVALAAAAFAQSQPTLNCDNNGDNGRRSRHCQMQEQTIAYTGQLTVDGGQNGGIAVKGASRSDVLVRARIEAWGSSDAEAQALAQQIRLNISAGKVSAEGPDRSGDHNWGVSYEIFVPTQADLHLTTHNGGLHVSDINGRLEFSAVNGGVHLSRVNGHVQGKTTNGGVHIELAGSRWEGDGMDVSTTNGGVHLTIPANYSAHLETSTVNGSIHPATSMNVAGKIDKQLSANIGGGGATLRLTTTNGGVHVDQI